MPPKRRSSGPATNSQQSTLAFHGASNKVTKAGTRAPAGKNNVISEVSKKKEVKPEVINIVEEPTTAETAIIDQTTEEVVAQPESAPEDIEARRVTDAAIKKYWAAKEKQRVAPRVHQQDLSLHEKILREFDMSGQYGPCTGIARLKRWRRAYRLDLDPPIEVLAVLLREMDVDSNVELQRSQVDELLNSKVKVDAT
ncbi:DNA polymerase delta, subunit 4-domain-containing protein [Paraphoma chrysanthemicola]|uniref:DNA polymerase delta, subunit 4-domain-containing protein n=1 Tax=Paraphoma chrysanthemicola TaxID=798071 RepID=A0A8K0RBE0_9PLEO|nr:DNA polymerase delta, subunit 4-domain-containing protein [Paraphoma chrysanthemicola]